MNLINPPVLETNMKPAGSVVEGGEWNSFNGVYVNEEADFMAQLFPNCSLASEVGWGSSVGAGATCWTGPESNYIMAEADGASNYPSDVAKSNLYCFSQGSSYSDGSTSSSIYPTAGHENYYLSDCHPLLAVNNRSMSVDFFMADEKNNSVQVPPDNRIEGDDCLIRETSSRSFEESSANGAGCELADKHLQLKTEYEVLELDLALENKNSGLLHNKKRPLVSVVQKGKRNVRSKKNRKLDLGDNNDEDNKATLNRQNSCNYSSEDDSSGSQEANGGNTSSLSSESNSVLNLNVKSRASRGSATDPQSLYARKRREKINERLRTLQSIVPNGTKVDISTMLEEAVLYVKFLQLQIKFLSSDDSWMYAPIAYNGMDIGLDLKINTLR